MRVIMPFPDPRINPGRTRSVRKVDVMIPPIATVAIERCTSAPALVERAIGRYSEEAYVQATSVQCGAADPR
jgi:hypothetical protein